MGVLQAGLLNQPSAQVIDGSLKFDGSKSNRLIRTFGSAGNRTSWTWSSWVKRDLLTLSNRQVIFGGFSASNNTDWLEIGWDNSADHVYWTSNGVTSDGTAQRRDPASWYHFLSTYDGRNLSIYVNNRLDLHYSVTGNMGINVAGAHYIGQSPKNAEDRHLDGRLTQCYFIDGQALGPGYFGFTDPLTGTWRPKKFRAEGTTVNDGTVWSNAVPTADGFRPGRAAADGFDGDLTTYVALNNTTFNLDVGSWGISGTMEVYTGANMRYATDGSSASDMTADNWTTVGDAGSISTLTFTRSDSNYPYFYAIRVDGVILIDSTTQNLAFGTNGFYLPMDGNSPIGQDKSGNGNNFTPVNFGGSAGVDQATGALPILEGAGGAVANVATRTDANASSLVLALPLVGSANDVSNHINSGSTTKTVTVNSATANYSLSNFYGGSYYFNGSSTLALSSLSGSNITDFTFESWIYLPNTSSQYGFFSNQTGDNNANTMRIGTSGGSAMWMKIGSNSLQTSSGTVPSTRWFHLAVTRSGSTVTIYLDGVNSATMTTSDYINASGFYVGVTYPTTTFRLNGYMQDVRFYTSAKYTSNFVPASPSPDILPDTPSGVSGGSKLTKITNGAVAFDGSNDYLTLPSGTDFAFGTGDFTVECYVYSNNRGTYDYIIDGRTSGQTSGTWSLSYGYASGNGRLEFASGSSTLLECPASLNPEKNKWTHIAITRSGTDLRMFIDGVVATSATNSTNFSTAPGTSYIGTRYSQEHFWDGFISNVRVIKGTALYTSAFTPPTAPLTNVTNTKLLCCQSNTSAGSAVVSPNITGAGTTNSGVVWSDNTTGTIFANRPKENLFDGDTSTSMAPGTSGVAGITTVTLTIPGGLSNVTSVRVYVDAKQVNQSPSVTLNSDSAQSISDSAQWVTLTAPSGGTLNTVKFTGNATSTINNLVEFNAFEVNGVILTDPVKRVGDTAATNFNPFNTDIHTVRGQETGYATLNPLFAGADKLVLSDGNLTATAAGTNQAGNWKGAVSTFGATSGKWYAEFLVVALGGSNHANIGISPIPKQTTPLQGQTDGGHFYNVNGGAWNAGSISNSVHTAAVAGDTIGVTVDFDANQIKWYLNGVLDYTVTLNTNIINNGFVWALANYTTSTVKANFGQKPFKFPPPDGFQPLNAANVRPSTVIARPDQYVGVKLFSIPDDGSGGSVTLNNDFDMVWTKNRTNSSTNHVLQDSVRGYGDNKSLHPNLNVAQTSTQNITAVNGRTLTIGSNSNYYDNNVVWSWKAGGSSKTWNIDGVGYDSAAAAGLTNTTGASIGTKQGFGIIKYTGNSTGVNAGSEQTLTHNMGKAPVFVLAKNLDNNHNWNVLHHKAVTSSHPNFYQNAMYLNTNDALPNTSNVRPWGNFAPTTTTIKVNNSSGGNNQQSLNYNGVDYVLYMWAEVAGLQKFGSYIGNTTEGPFVELGFRPAVVIIKCITQNWYFNLQDSKRSPFNPSKGNFFQFNSSGGENSASGNNNIDFLSNGFKIRSTTAQSEPTNLNGQTYIYMAWAEAPSFNLYGGQSSAR